MKDGGLVFTDHFDWYYRLGNESDWEDYASSDEHSECSEATEDDVGELQDLQAQNKEELDGEEVEGTYFEVGSDAFSPPEWRKKIFAATGR